VKGRGRVGTLECYPRHRLPPSHLLPVVYDPWPEADQERWVREEVVCAWGEKGCPQMAGGALLPENAPSAEMWTARVQRDVRERRISDAPTDDDQVPLELRLLVPAAGLSLPVKTLQAGVGELKAGLAPPDPRATACARPA
jgi:hypothetical protein